MSLRLVRTLSFALAILANTQPALGACGRDKVPAYSDIDAVWYERTGCFGECPSYQVLFWNYGGCYYIGFGNVSKRGTYRQACSSAVLRRARNALQAHDFYGLNYDPRVLVLDAPHFIVAVRRCGVTTKLDWPAHENWKGFESLLNGLDAITSSINWRKISSSTAPLERWVVLP